MSSLPLIVSMNRENRAELVALLAATGHPGHVSEARALDGDTVCTVLLVLTSTSLAGWREWLKYRVDTRAQLEVKVGGVTLHGYSPDEILQLGAAVDAEAIRAGIESPDAE